ncbi:MAG: autotransporter assembly complex protein TamA [Chromatiaceae bacterium]|nr:autotransporter assembly complex protein TamA [Chromatiaceae bacterium]
MRRNFCFFLLLLGLVAQAGAGVVLDTQGGSAALEENLRARLRLQTEPCDAPRSVVQRVFKQAEKDFDPALRAFGYYRAKVVKELSFEDDCWHAVFTFDLGQRVVIRKRDIVIRGEAADDPKLGGLLAGLPLPEGAPLNHAEYEAIKDRLRQFAIERGYLDFAFSRQELRVYPDESVADIHLEADSGPRYHFGELRLSEQPLDEELVRRMANLTEGEFYDTAKIAALNRVLSDSPYFARVEVRPRRDQAVDHAVPIDILLEPAKRHAWRAGIGFETDLGPRGSLRYDNRYVNARGHHFESALSVSPVLSTLGAEYVIPGDDPIHESFGFGAKLTHEDTDSAVSDSASLTARHTLQSEGWNQNRFIELLHEKSDVGGEKTTSTLLMPGIAFDHAEGDDVLRTRRGYRVRFEARGAHEALLSTASFVQLSASAKGIYRFGQGGRVTGRVDGGVTVVPSITDLPASLRFFAGGDNSVRGYAYQSLGPLDDKGEVRGGKNLLTASLEYEHPVVGEDWWAAAFVDAGNAFDSDQFELRSAYGVGVRWYSPVGRVRLDVAFPDDTSDGSWRVHFGLGTDL